MEKFKCKSCLSQMKLHSDITVHVYSAAHVDVIYIQEMSKENIMADQDCTSTFQGSVTKCCI